MAEQSLGGVKVYIGGDVSGLAVASAQAGGLLRGLDSRIDATMHKLELWGALIHVVGIALVEKFAAAGKQLDDTAKQIGTTTDRLQAYQYGAAIAGVETGVLTVAFQKFSRELGESSAQITPFRQALGQLGIDFQNLKKLKFDDALALVQDRLSKIEDVTKRNNIAFDIFGRTGVKAVNFLSLSADAMGKFTKEAEKAGVIISKDTIHKAAELSDEFDKMGISLKATSIRMSAEFLPAAQKIREFLTDPSVQAGAANIARYIGEIVKYLVDNKETVLTVIGALGGAMAGGAVLGRLGSYGKLLGVIGGGAVGAKMALDGMKDEITKLDDELSNAVDKLRQWRDAAESTNPIVKKMFTPEEIAKNIKIQEALIDDLTKRYNAAQKAAMAASNAAKLIVPVHTDTPNGPAAVPVFPEISKAIEDTRLKGMQLRNELKGIAEGFPDLLKGMNLKDVDVLKMVSDGVGKISGQFKQLNEEMVKNVEIPNIQKALLTETELMQLELDKRLGYLKTYEAMKTVEVGKAEAIRNKLVEKSNNDMRVATAKQYSALANIVDTSLSQIRDLVGDRGGAAFEIMKGISMATALVKGYEATVSAYAQGSAIGGPMVGAAFAAIAAAGTAAVIAKLAMTRPGGAQETPSAPPTGGAEAATTSAGGSGGGGNGGQTIFIQGVKSGMNYSGDQLRELFKAINSHIADGGKIVMG
jgi:hypothetical protein